MGQRQNIQLVPDSLAYRAYQEVEVKEAFHCNYGLNPAFRQQMEKGTLKVTGVDMDGDVRIVEIPSHRFFLATLFLPQLSSQPENPHPLILTYIQSLMT